jgi:hypothetical protein
MLFFCKKLRFSYILQDFLFGIGIWFWVVDDLGSSHQVSVVRALWQYGFWSFQVGDTKLERFLHKNQHTQRKLLTFEFWINGELSKKCQNWTFKVNLLCQKLFESFSIFFSLKNTYQLQFRSTFFVIDIF